MAFMSLSEVNQGQHHHDECLQQHDQNVEQPPAQASHDLSERTQGTAERTERQCVAAQKSNQEEKQFACVHVTEKSHAKANRFGDVLNDIQSAVERTQKPVTSERSREQLVEETAGSLDLEAVIDHQHQHAHRNAQRAVQVGSRQRTQIVHAEESGDPGKKVDRDQVDGVHQNNPDKNRQSAGRNESAITVDNGFTLFFNHADEHFDGALKLTGNAAVGLLRNAVKKEQADKKHQNREDDSVVVNDREVDNRRHIARAVVLQMVKHVLGCGTFGSHNQSFGLSV